MVERFHHETNMKREKNNIEFEDEAVNVLNQYIN